MRKKIEFSMTTFDVVALMSEGNPGALTAMAVLMKSGGDIFDILSLDDMNIRGSQIWVAYKDHCGEEVQKFIACIKTRDPAMVATVNRECARTGTDERAVTNGGSWR